MRFTILHTNDIHGHLLPWRGWEGELRDKTIGGLAVLAGAIRNVRREVGEQCLLLDAGDLIGDTMLADLTQGKALVQALNHLHYDAWTLGNHEPDFGVNTLRQRISDAEFPAVACNVFEENGDRLFTKPYIMKQFGNLLVGVVGAAYPKTQRTTAAKNVQGIRFEQPDLHVAKQVARLRAQGVSIVVLLSHLGLGADFELAANVKDIDVIVGGHSHNRMQRAEVVNSTLIVQSGAHCSDLGRLDLVVENGKISSHERSLLLLDNAIIAPDPQAQQLLDQLAEPHQKVAEEILGSATDWLTRAQTLAGTDPRKRDEESPVDSLFADLIRNETKCDLAFLPGVGYGVAIPPGPIQASQLRQLVPHDGKVVTMRLAGARIIDILEQAVDNVFSNDTSSKVGGMIQVSGLRFSYDPKNPKGHRILSIARTEGQWDAALDYSVATNSMLAKGGHNQDSFLHGQSTEELTSQFEMLASVIRKSTAIKPPPVGRIKPIPSR
jgi:5'-nucleotidase / UDP-sugar diphosphatase